MKAPAKIQPTANIESVIFIVRGEKVLLDMDLAQIYAVPTKRLNEQARRNSNRFPGDFLFQLTAEGFESLRSQIATASKRNVRYLLYAFAEQGAIIAANVLNSPQAVRMSAFVMHAFLKMRELLGGTKALAHQLKALEAKLTARLDGHIAAIVDVLQRLMRLLDPPPEPELPRRQIGVPLHSANMPTLWVVQERKSSLRHRPCRRLSAQRTPPVRPSYLAAKRVKKPRERFAFTVQGSANRFRQI